MEKKFTTRAQVKQRMGRAGRTQEGICYHLYTEKKFNSLEEFPSPAIALVNLNDHFLSFLKYEKYLSDAIFLSKNLITPVTPYQLSSSIRYLHFYNLIKIVSLEQEAGYKKSSKLSIKKIKRILYNAGSYSDSDNTSNEELESESESDDLYKIEDSLQNKSHLTFKMISYKNMNKYEDWAVYQGCLTRFGKIIHSLNGYPIELVMLAFYGKLLSLPMIYSMVSIIIAMDYKIENLIQFPDNDKTSFINENFPDAIPYYYSEHLFVYNLLTNYYELGNKLELLNTQVFDKATEIKNLFSKVLDKIKDNDIDEINKKYNLIPTEIDIDNLELMEKVYLAIFMAYRYNTIRLIDKHNKPIYQTQY